MLERRGRIHHRLVEEQPEEIVAQVVVRGDVAARAGAAVAADRMHDFSQRRGEARESGFEPVERVHVQHEAAAPRRRAASWSSNRACTPRPRRSIRRTPRRRTCAHRARESRSAPARPRWPCRNDGAPGLRRSRGSRRAALSTWRERRACRAHRARLDPPRESDGSSAVASGLRGDVIDMCGNLRRMRMERNPLPPQLQCLRVDAGDDARPSCTGMQAAPARAPGR